MDYKKINALKLKRELEIKNAGYNIPITSGIYVFYRIDINGLKFCYCGQAINLKERISSHLSEFDRIALSLKTRGFYSNDNPNGWKIVFKHCNKDKLDENEKLTIKFYADKGYQLYNRNLGGSIDKGIIGEGKSTKGYQQGIIKGYNDARKEVADLFKKHLNFETKNVTENKIQLRAFKKFEEFIDIE